MAEKDVYDKIIDVCEKTIDQIYKCETKSNVHTVSLSALMAISGICGGVKTYKKVEGE